MKLRIDLSCGACGSNRLDIPAQAVDDSAVTCQECGHALGSLAELKTRVEQAVLRGQGEGRQGSGAPAAGGGDAIDRRSSQER